MTPNLEALKRKFREGQHEPAIAECEALCLQYPARTDILRLCANMHTMVRNYPRALDLFRRLKRPGHADPDVLFNIGLCARALKDFSGAAQAFAEYTQAFPDHPDGWASLAECRLQLNEFAQGAAAAERAIALDPASAPAWTVRGNCQRALGQLEDAITSFTRAIELLPAVAELRVRRAEAWEAAGKLEAAAADYKAALASSPADDAALKKATLCLLQLGRGEEGIQLCRDALKADPSSVTAKLGAEWLLAQMVPLWHVPMMNEPQRNQPYHDALASAVTPDKVVFEIGTGSGLLAMMAAKLGARQVVTCEAVRLVADTARQIVERNGLQAQVTVLAKPSYAVEPGRDLPEKADILLHEIFSSELLGEHVLTALEDAKARLLKPGGLVLPATASIMIALVAGEELGKELHVDHAFGFDLRPFNAIHPKKRPVHREDLPRVLLGEAVEAFRFDFQNQASFPPEKKRVVLAATQPGRCWGVIQWIRFEFGGGRFFENHPSQRRPVTNWQHTIYRFDEPMALEAGDTVAIDAMHDRQRPWFEKAPVG